jgi:CheY-like chemotaxis protein
MPAAKQIVLVGHCGPDSYLLRYAVSKAVGGVPLHAADDSASLEPYATPDSLLLVNRVLGGSFANDNGIDLIRELAARPAPPRMMLISNYAEAQAQAVAAGALPGFGKAQTHEPRVAQSLRAALEDSPH